MNSPQKIVILGAGLAGLAAGFELAKAGKKVLILEKNPYVGGLATTFKVGDYRFDTGPHRWFTKINEVDKWVRDLMGKELITVRRLTRIYFSGRYFYYPIKPFEALAGIGPVKGIQAVLDYLVVKLKNKLNPKPVVTMEDAYVQQFGRTLYKIFFENYSEKLWGRSCKQLSGDWVAQRSRGMSILTVIRNAFFPQKDKVVSLVEAFSYPKLGVGRISERLSEEIKKRGGEVILGAEVKEVKTEGKRIRNIVIQRNGQKEELEADEVISSIPLNELVIRLTPSISEQASQAVAKLSFRDEVFVVLFLKSSKITPDQWIYTQDPTLPFVRLVETDNWSKFLSPTGTTSLVFEVACDRNDKIWNRTDEKLVKWVTEKYIKEFKTIDKNDIVASFVHRQENEYPVYTVGYEKPLKIIKGYLRKLTNLQIIGRAGMYRYNNMDHTIQSGIWAARNLLGGNYNIESINLEKDYHEEKRTA